MPQSPTHPRLPSGSSASSSSSTHLYFLGLTRVTALTSFSRAKASERRRRSRGRRSVGARGKHTALEVLAVLRAVFRLSQQFLPYLRASRHSPASTPALLLTRPLTAPPLVYGAILGTQMATSHIYAGLNNLKTRRDAWLPLSKRGNQQTLSSEARAGDDRIFGMRARPAQHAYSAALPLEIQFVIIDEFEDQTADLRERRAVPRVSRVGRKRAIAALPQHLRAVRAQVLNTKHNLGRQVINDSVWWTDLHHFRLLEELALTGIEQLPHLRTLDFSHTFRAACDYAICDLAHPHLESLYICHCDWKDTFSQLRSAIARLAWHLKYLALRYIQESTFFDWLVAETGGADGRPLPYYVGGAQCVHVKRGPRQDRRWAAPPRAPRYALLGWSPRPDPDSLPTEVPLSVRDCTALTTLTFSGERFLSFGTSIPSVLAPVASTSPPLTAVFFHIPLNTRYFDVPASSAVFAPYAMAVLHMKCRMGLLQACGLLQFVDADPDEGPASAYVLAPLPEPRRPTAVRQKRLRRLWDGLAAQADKQAIVTKTPATAPFSKLDLRRPSGLNAMQPSAPMASRRQTASQIGTGRPFSGFGQMLYVGAPLMWMCAPPAPGDDEDDLTAEEVHPTGTAFLPIANLSLGLARNSDGAPVSPFMPPLPTAFPELERYPAPGFPDLWPEPQPTSAPKPRHREMAPPWAPRAPTTARMATSVQPPLAAEEALFAPPWPHYGCPHLHRLPHSRAPPPPNSPVTSQTAAAPEPMAMRLDEVNRLLRALEAADIAGALRAPPPRVFNPPAQSPPHSQSAPPRARTPGPFRLIPPLYARFPRLRCGACRAAGSVHSAGPEDASDAESDATSDSELDLTWGAYPAAAQDDAGDSDEDEDEQEFFFDAPEDVPIAGYVQNRPNKFPGCRLCRARGALAAGMRSLEERAEMKKCALGAEKKRALAGTRRCACDHEFIRTIDGPSIPFHPLLLTSLRMGDIDICGKQGNSFCSDFEFHRRRAFNSSYSGMCDAVSAPPFLPSYPTYRRVNSGSLRLSGAHIASYKQYLVKGVAPSLLSPLFPSPAIYLYVDTPAARL
ncbi:hypothetical protein GGX14DRAFT_406711 [Mycena pura]|uniref:Uncharacterized protein n=1 Tax=Mycena pura TaxID=153505 RepID=A0AAD6Y311_9AGAR|nr:hypothetical protein GGX14DRAFT_406711 [Mycena pura]